ncbi:hypothetical protein [Butyrivibrio sp. INlla16]|uniref:hypothetical protein n=1 Tax=Butyrivibrio sp. INlla16 TaxID=1520807 RepID=UPI0008849954|nr:hypothetical protein [Butyrivibrio sp. INlla16]SDB45131.1 hypothetical protein SAMN02910263_02195 [Butyrivibrio sp. INlla16]
MSSEKERWEILDKLDMGYSLDEDNSGQVIEDICVHPDDVQGQGKDRGCSAKRLSHLLQEN